MLIFASLSLYTQPRWVSAWYFRYHPYLHISYRRVPLYAVVLCNTILIPGSINVYVLTLDSMQNVTCLPDQVPKNFLASGVKKDVWVANRNAYQ